MTDDERAICRANPAKLRIVHFDARDRWPSCLFESESKDEIKKAWDGMMSLKQLECAIFNDAGENLDFSSITDAGEVSVDAWTDKIMDMFPADQPPAPAFWEK